MKKLLLLLPMLLLASPAMGQDRSQMLGTVNGSVSIATGNTFQTVLTAATSATRRNSLTIQNNNSADSCWLVVGGALGSATKAIAMLLLPGGSYTRYYPYTPSDAIHATCTTSADTLYIDTQ